MNKENNSKASWCGVVHIYNQALGAQEKDQEFKASLGYIGSWKVAWDT